MRDSPRSPCNGRAGAGHLIDDGAKSPTASATFSRAGRSINESIDRLPKGEALIPFLDLQLFELSRLAQARQVRVAPPARKSLPHPTAGRGVNLQCLAPGGQVRPQPLPRLLAPARPVLVAQLRPVLTETAAREGGRARGGVAIASAGFLGHLRTDRERIGVQARCGGEAALKAKVTASMPATI